MTDRTAPFSQLFLPHLAAVGLVALVAGPVARSSAHGDVEGRLLSLDVVAAQEDLAAVAAAHPTAQALEASEESLAASFLSLSAGGVGLAPGGVTFEVARGPHSDVVRARVALEGHVADLLPYLAGIQHQRAVPVVEHVHAEVAPGGRFSGEVVVQYRRPVAADDAWIAARLEAYGPTVAATLPVLEAAHEEARWRAFGEDLAKMREAGPLSVRRAHVQLPARLVALARDGGTLSWSPAD